jgi:hypothetical protein
MTATLPKFLIDNVKLQQNTLQPTDNIASLPPKSTSFHSNHVLRTTVVVQIDSNQCTKRHASGSHLVNANVENHLLGCPDPADTQAAPS